MKLTIFILFISASLIYSQSQSELLERAYKKNSKILLDEFLLNWQNEIKTISKDELETQNDTAKAIYEIFNELFKNDTLRYYNPQINSSKYLLIQNKIRYAFADLLYDKFLRKNSYANEFIVEINPSYFANDSAISEIDRELSDGHIILSDTSFNFKPHINHHDNIVYINDSYQTIMRKYLFDDSTARNVASDWVKIKRTQGEIEKRVSFINKIFQMENPFQSGWRLYSEPEVYNITFGKDFKTAQLSLIMFCNIWKAYFIKQDNNWIMIGIKDYACICG
jgi:hypothetical protein